MTEQEVWPLATEIWEKRKKIKNFDGVSIVKLKSGYGIDTSDNFFSLKQQVRRFLDGLEE